MARLLNKGLLPTVRPNQCAQRFKFIFMTLLSLDTLALRLQRLSVECRGVERIADCGGELADFFERNFCER